MLNHKGTDNIKTERLLLRRFELSDAEPMFKNWASDHEVFKYLRGKCQKDIGETKAIIQARIEKYQNPAFYHWIITLKDSKEQMGTIGLFIVNEIDECGEVAYCIGRKFNGNGYTTEALQNVLKFAFEEIGFNRIEACHAINNPASGRVMQKAGMRFEGMARQKYRSSLGFEDSNMYAMLKEDYYYNKI
jgi:ribosomal-protein-alanine N-acetyltransferase